jgi:signal transduction histidine kinase
MIRFHNLPIHTKLILIIMSVALSTLLLASTVLIIYDTRQVKQIMGHELANSAHLLGNRSNAALIFDDPQLARENLLALQELPHVSLGCIYRQDGELFAAYIHINNAQGACPIKPDVTDYQVSFSSNFMQLTLPIKTKDKRLGYIYLRSSLVAINQRVQQQIYVIVLLTIIVGLFAFWLSRKLQKIISQPIIEVARLASRIEQQGDYSQRAPAGGNDELGQLNKSFNAMLDTIEKQNQQLLEAKNNLEVQVKNRTHELEAANKELETFSYTVSHDLKAPLRSITGFSQIILEDYHKALDAEGQDLLTRVLDNTQRMSELIEDLLELSRLGRKTLNRVPVDVNDLVAEVIKSLQTTNNQRKIEFMSDVPGTVIADQRLLKIVFENILGNACKYTSKIDKACIEIGKKVIQGEDVFFIRDNGAGFDMTYATKIFAAFQRLHKRDEFEGTGIGLATVERIIHRHGGKIWVEAEVDKGATFYFTIPDNTDYQE